MLSIFGVSLVLHDIYSGILQTVAVVGVWDVKEFYLNRNSNVKMLTSMYSLYSCAVTRMFWAPRKLQTQIEHNISLKNFNTACSYITNYYCKLVWSTDILSVGIKMPLPHFFWAKKIKNKVLQSFIIKILKPFIM